MMAKLFYRYGILLLTSLSIGVALYMLNNGISFQGKPNQFMAICSVIFLLVELAKPFQKGSFNLKRSIIDIGFPVFNKTVITGLWATFFIPFSMKITGAKQFTDMAFLQNYMPLWAEVILAIFVVEFMRYWAHRAQHAIPILWRFHALHHSQGNPYILNVYTNHPLDELLRGVIPYFLLFPMGFSGESFFLAFACLLATGVQTHSNAPFKNADWINKVFPTNELHRWHHSTDLTEGNKNFGTGLIIWDRVFGTYFLPKDREAPNEYGVPVESQPKLNPFKWAYIQPEPAKPEKY